MNYEIIDRTFKDYKNKYQKRLSSKERININLNESPTSFFRTGSNKYYSKVGLDHIGNTKTNIISDLFDRPGKFKRMSTKPDNRKKRFDDILDNYFSSLPNNNFNEKFERMRKTTRDSSRSQKRLQDAMEAVNNGFNLSISRKTNIYGSHLKGKYTTLINTPIGKKSVILGRDKNSYNSDNQYFTGERVKKEVLSDEVGKILGHIERMSSEEFLGLSFSYKNDLNKLAQLITQKQKGLI